MSTHYLKRAGSATIEPPGGNPSGQPTTLVQIDDTLALSNFLSTVVYLTTDSPVSVSLGPLTGVNYLSIRSGDAATRARLTSSVGSTQAVSVYPFLEVRSDTVPITAIDLTRTAGIDSEVFIVMGQKA